MTDLPDVKLKALVSFPATIIDGAGIDVARINGGFRFDIAYDDFAPPLTTIADPTHSVMLVWNTVSGQYGLAPTSLLLGSGSAFPSSSNPLVDGVATPGTSLLYARGDHVHPPESSTGSGSLVRADSPLFLGDPRAPTPAPGDNDTSLATTAFVTSAITGSLSGSGFAPLASPIFTGDPRAPTPTAGDSDTSIATTAFVTSAVSTGIAGLAPLASPVFTGDPKSVTPSPGDNDTSIATTAFVNAALPVAATAAEYAANSAPTKMLTPGAAWNAAPPVPLTGTSVTPDFSSGFDFTWTMSLPGSTLNNPTSLKAGQKGMVYLVQGAASCTITTWGGFYKFPGGVKPTQSTAIGSVDVISYAVKSSTEVECFFAAGMA